MLGDLRRQTVLPDEVICFDDDSRDRTGAVACSFGARLIRNDAKPADWTGKSWGCAQGAAAANGELLLFLDADVRLRPDAIDALLCAYEKHRCAISVAPYHRTEKNYEQFSLFFNLIQVSANGVGTGISFKNAGLYGPVILIDRKTYCAVGGHTAVKSSVVDDLALGKKLKQKGFSYRLFLGGKMIAYRMYGDGFPGLLHGWTKNYAAGAVQTPPLLFGLVFFWVAACILSPFCLLRALLLRELPALIPFFVLYLLWVLELFRISGKIGSFRKEAIFLFPVNLVLFLFVFCASAVKKIFRLNVAWKGRNVKPEN